MNSPWTSFLRQLPRRNQLVLVVVVSMLSFLTILSLYSRPSFIVSPGWTGLAVDDVYNRTLGVGDLCFETQSI